MKIFCAHCQTLSELTDSTNCCPGNTFCLHCRSEISIETGELVQLCGKCPACKELMIEGHFATLKDIRTIKMRGYHGF